MIFRGGSNFAAIKSIDDQSLSDFDFLIRAGRAVAIPVFKGSLHRDRQDSIGMPVTVGAAISPLGYRDILIQWIKDLSWTIDYIETRDDLDAATVAFFGFSWGGLTGRSCSPWNLNSRPAF